MTHVDIGHFRTCLPKPGLRGSRAGRSIHGNGQTHSMRDSIMNVERSRRSAELAWKSRANKARKEIIPKLAGLGEYDFLDMKESIELGGRFWREVQNLPYIETTDFPKAFETFSRLDPNKLLLWFHRFTDEAGAIVAKLGPLARQIMNLRREFGPDVLVAAYDFQFGLCFEEEENDSHLRLWGLHISRIS